MEFKRNTNKYKPDILPFGKYARAWRKRCGMTAAQLAEAIGEKNVNLIYQFESGFRASWQLLSKYIIAGLDITYEMTKGDEE